MGKIWRAFKRRFIGDRFFYRKVLMVAVPIVIQNSITNFVNLLDNVMVGRIGTEQMSGVSIVNQLVFIFNLCIFGVMSSAGIFGSQFYGDNNTAGLRDTMRFKLISGVLVSAVGMAVMYLFGEQLIGLYLTGEESTVDRAQTLSSGMEYLRVAVWGFLPFAIANAYASTLRETSETIRPMLAGLAAVALNLIFNYLLIFGKFGFPEMGVQGAALATVMSRFLEISILVIWTHKHTERNRFAAGLYRSFRIKKGLTGQIIRKGLPLTANETLFAAGIAMLTQCYSIRGVDVVAGLNISSTLSNTLNMVFISMGNTIAILVGQMLGAGDFDGAREWARKMIAFSMMLSLITVVLMLALSGIFPYAYNTDQEVRDLASGFIVIYGLTAPLGAFMNASYFTIRSGGKTLITFLFDSAAIWVICVPIAWCLGHFTTLHIFCIVAAVQLSDIIKCTVGFILVKKGVWVRRLVD